VEKVGDIHYFFLIFLFKSPKQDYFIKKSIEKELSNYISILRSFYDFKRIFPNILGVRKCLLKHIWIATFKHTWVKESKLHNLRRGLKNSRARSYKN